LARGAVRTRRLQAHALARDVEDGMLERKVFTVLGALPRLSFVTAASRPGRAPGFGRAKAAASVDRRS
jgi:hypothetical protein